MIELYEERIINGVLKAGITNSPEVAAELLNCDWEIVIPLERSGQDDLWPAVWALSSVLSRQFRGKVFIHAGLEILPEMPIPLGQRCSIVTDKQVSARQIGLGCSPEGSEWFGDARGNTISIGELIDSEERASPESGFAVAGYLGFAALASSVGIPSFREEYTVKRLVLASNRKPPFKSPEKGIAFIGLGHLGNCYLALLFFLAHRSALLPRVHLVDCDRFAESNYQT